MSRRANFFDLVLGTVVLCVVAILVFFGLTATRLGGTGYFDLVAHFDNIGGLKVGSEVRLSGVKIGKVVDIDLDRESYQAIVSMRIDQDIKIPEDSSIKFASKSLLGSFYLEITPGGSDRFLKDNGKIMYTQGYVNLMNMVQSFISGNNDIMEIFNI